MIGHVNSDVGSETLGTNGAVATPHLKLSPLTDGTSSSENSNLDLVLRMC